MLENKEKPNPTRFALLPAVVTPVASAKQTIDTKTLEGANGVINTGKQSKAVKRRAKWKKPKDKPKRPLSAYNIFFKEQREILMQDKLSSSTTVRGFSGLAKFVGAKWKTLDAASRSVYEKRALEEKKQYYVALEEWKHGKEQKRWNRRQIPRPPLGNNNNNNNKIPPYTYSMPLHPMMGPLGIPVSPFRNNFLCYPNPWMNGLLPSQQYQNLPSVSPLEKELKEFENSLPPSDASLVEDDSNKPFSSWLEDAFEPEKDPLHNNIDDSSNVNQEERNTNSTAMTRVLQSFDQIGVDEEFANLVSSLEW